MTRNGNRNVILKDRVIDYLISVVRKTERTRKERFVYSVLMALSKVYGLVLKVRLRLFRWGLLRNRTFGCLVISVGNITAGGTGKTPIVEVFARALSEEGRKVAILTRGYRRRPGKNKKSIVVVQGEEPKVDPREVGDEAYMLARNLKGVPVVVGADRLMTGEYAISKLGADTLILDDGYQYLSLTKRINIVCVDANNPFGNNNLIPAGFLREPLEALGRANLFFLTKVRADTNGEKTKIHEQLKAYNKDAAVVETTYAPKGFIELEGGSMSALDAVAGKKVIAFSAIADPEGFERLLVELKAEIAESFRFHDHHFFTGEELSAVDARCRDLRAAMIVMTEKDSVKLPAGFRFKSRAAYLKVDVAILNGADNFTDCISKLCFT
jgi:tetraacyldisaccharide 4'-kinase